MKKLIEVKSLTKKYKNLKAVDDLSFFVYENEILGLLGPNGSGKTTTINSMLSLLNFDKGEITFFGKTMTPDSQEIKKEIGVVFQDVAVFEELTVYENIDYFCGLYIEDKISRKKCVDDAIKLVKLEEFINYKPRQLSGGLKRRLNIACGIAHKPKIIFLDEPTVAVDPQSRNNILDGIKKLRKNGATIIYTSHYMEEVEILCDRIIILDKGKIIGEGTKEELKELTGIEEKVTIEIEELDTKHIEEFKKQENVKNVEYTSGRLEITYTKGKNNFTKLIDYLKKEDIAYNKIFSERPTLNDVFLELTGKELRD